MSDDVMTPAEAQAMLAQHEARRATWRQTAERDGGFRPDAEVVASMRHEARIARGIVAAHAARVAAEAEAEGLRRDLVAVSAERDLYRAALADAARGEAWKCDTHHGGVLATQVHADGCGACDACAAGDGREWAEAPHAEAIRGALRAAMGGAT